MKISTIIENMKKYHKGYGTIDEEKTRDKVLYGNVDQEMYRNCDFLLGFC